MAFRIRLPKMVTLAAALVLVLALIQSEGISDSALGVEPDGPDFSMEVVGAGCDTDSDPPEDTCEVVAGESFTVRVNLNSVAGVGPGYRGVQVRLQLPGEYPSGTIPADLNGDGLSDLIAFTRSHREESHLAVFLNNGDGTLRDPVTLDTERGSRSVGVGDLDGDSTVDLLIAGDPVTILLGNGDGTFSARQGNFATHGRIALVDLNGDFSLDLIDVSHFYLWTRLGNGDGTFQGTSRRMPIDKNYGFRIDDVNADGAPDLIATNSQELSILLGNGDGTFRGEQHIAAGENPRSMETADLNLDGALDIVVARAESDELTILLGNGDGTFEAQDSLRAGDVARWPSFGLADVNGDTTPDIVVANSESKSVGVLLGVGDGTFGSEQRFDVGREPLSVAVTELNGDGVPDIVTANYEAGNVSVLLGNGDGTFQAEHGFPARLQLGEARMVSPAGCSFGATAIGHLGRILLGCTGTRFYESLYTGPVAEVAFTCPNEGSSHVVKMQHYDPNGTYLIDQNLAPVLDPDEDESLTINCVPETVQLSDPLAEVLPENDDEQVGSVADLELEPGVEAQAGSVADLELESGGEAQAGAETVLALPSTGTPAPAPHSNRLPLLAITLAALGLVTVASSWWFRRQRLASGGSATRP